MITRQDLLEAIAECQGTRSPNANTAIKLAAFYTILDHLNEDTSPTNIDPMPSYSFDAPPYQIYYDGDSEFAQAINGRDQAEVWPVIDELMTVVKVMNSKLYKGVMKRLS